jgi:hypothetical protein
MNKIEELFLTLVIGDYILDQATKDKRNEMIPRPFAYIRDKYLQYKITSHKCEEAKE